MAIRRCPRFRFDYFFRSCPLDMISRRCEHLLRCAGKEVEALERKAREVAGLPTEAEEGKELPPIKLPPYREMQLRQRIASRKKFEEEKQALEGKVDELEAQMKEIQQQLKDLTNQANLPPPPPPPPPPQPKPQKENKSSNGDTAKPAKKRARSIDEPTATENDNKSSPPAAASKSSSKKGPDSSNFDPSQGDLVDGEFVEFPEYDGTEEPKEPKKAFTQFCIRTRKEVKASLDESERKNKALVNEKLKAMWLELEDEKKAIFRSWAAWDKKRYARDDEIFVQAQKEAKKKKKKNKGSPPKGKESSSSSGMDGQSIPKKRQAGDSLSIPKKKRKA